MRVLASRRMAFGRDMGLRVEPGYVLVDGAYIVSVHRGGLAGARALAEERSCPLDDWGDRLVTPAFVNAHTHLALVFARALDPGSATAGNTVEEFFFRIEKRLGYDDVRALARMGAYESLLAGVGLVWDHYYFADAVAQACSDVGLCAVVAPTLQDVSGPGADGAAAALALTQNMAQDVSLQARGIGVALGPHATDTVSADLWRELSTVAGDLDLPVHVHVAQSVEEVERALDRHGCEPLAWLDEIGVLGQISGPLVHGLYLRDADLDRLDPQRHTLVWCPRSQAIFGFWARVDRWVAKGQPFVVATDCAATNDAMDVQAELACVAAMRTLPASFSAEAEDFYAGTGSAAAVWRRRTEAFAALDEVVQPRALLSRVWSAPGDLHPTVKAGVLEPGRLANLVVWDLDQPELWPAHDPLRALTLSQASRCMHAMLVGGKYVGEAGNLRRSVVSSPKYREARLEAEQRLTALMAP